ncbi:MAG: hypothetical protein U0936_02840 [Planctomycetaceae bacterium]
MSSWTVSAAIPDKPPDGVPVVPRGTPLGGQFFRYCTIRDNTETAAAVPVRGRRERRKQFVDSIPTRNASFEVAFSSGRWKPGISRRGRDGVLP